MQVPSADCPPRWLETSSRTRNRQSLNAFLGLRPQSRNMRHCSTPLEQVSLWLLAPICKTLTSISASLAVDQLIYVCKTSTPDPAYIVLLDRVLFRSPYKSTTAGTSQPKTAATKSATCHQTSPKSSWVKSYPI